ncbi:MAG: ABC transporter ATP-binding protein [Eubacteriales bacterium]|nr:ABC transporter ATP-binding protein [Eubacteriales bacterium]
MKLLSVQDVNVFYGSIHAIKDVSLDVEKGEIVTLIGANGAGKSTTMGAISGLLPKKSGKILFKDIDITAKPAEDITPLGIALSPEGRGIFPGLTVEDNLRLGAYLKKDKEYIKRQYERVYTMFPRLKERYKQVSGTLSGGEQQMLAVGRAIMSEPELLMLDEPSMGLAPNLVDFIFEIIVDINKQGTSILLVEQNANMALKIADRGYVLTTGSIVMEGSGKELLENPEIRKAYLGE